MTTIHRRTPDRDLLASYVDATNGSTYGSLEILENRPKTRLLLTRRFWLTASLLLVVVALSASYSTYSLLIARGENEENLNRFVALNATASELLSGALGINSLLTEYRFTGSNVALIPLDSAGLEVEADLTRLESIANELQDEEISLIVDSISMTVRSWEGVLTSLTNEAVNQSDEVAEIELIGSVARTIELLESKLNPQIEKIRDAEAAKSRNAVLIGVGSLLFAVGGTAMLVPMAVAGSIERLVILQRSNKERERRLGRATSSFLDNVNQELRTPLTSISGFSEILSNDDDSLDRIQQRRMIKTIYRNSQKMNELVDNVLTMLKIQTGEIRFKFTEFDARDVLRTEVKRRHELALMSDVKIIVSEPLEPVATVGDYEEISRAVRAVLDNAITYSKRGSTVEVAVRRADDIVEGPMVVFVVTDHGIGIPSDEMAGVLAAFERAWNAVSLSIAGAGLGLSIVDFIVFEHGGEWRISSIEHEGTEVELHFPCLHKVQDKIGNLEQVKEGT